MKNDANQARSPVQALKQYVFVLADGLRVAVRAENEYAAAQRAPFACAAARRVRL